MYKYMILISKYLFSDSWVYCLMLFWQFVLTGLGYALVHFVNQQWHTMLTHLCIGCIVRVLYIIKTPLQGTLNPKA